MYVYILSVRFFFFGPAFFIPRKSADVEIEWNVSLSCFL